MRIPRRGQILTAAVAGAALTVGLSSGTALAEHGLAHGPFRTPDGPVEFEISDVEGEANGEVYLLGHDNPVYASVWVADGHEFYRTLSLDLDVPVESGAGYAEAPSWSEAGLDAATMAKVQWIISLEDEPGSSVWQGGSDEILESIRAALADRGFDDATAGSMSDSDLIVGLQTAIWHFTNGVELDPDPARTTPELLALYEFLVGPANAGEAEPDAPGWLELSLSPEHLDGEAGDLIGPFVMTSNVGWAEIYSWSDTGAAESLRVVNAADEEVWVAESGAELFVDTSVEHPDVPGGVIEARAWRTFPGRVMTGEGPDLVLLNYVEEVAVRSSVAWDAAGESTPPPAAGGSGPTAEPTPPRSGPTLPETGASTALLAAAAIAMMGAGTALIGVSRRRRKPGV
jgi:LPXTG-motif cell wall-anchored protein